jgi:hypothetical protein
MEYYGTKLQVYNETAKFTKGGLSKKDIVRIKDSTGNYRYKSKKQQNSGKTKNTFREKWSLAMKQARKELIAEGTINKNDFVPIGGSTVAGKKLLSRIKELVS